MLDHNSHRENGVAVMQQHKCLQALIAGLAVLISSPATPTLAAPSEMAKYRFLENSNWIVPPATLPAISYELATGTATAVVDQTVWDITGYRDGYFWGRTAAQFRDAATGDLVSSACMHMVGSVTPSGKVHITFVNTDQETALTATRGTGKLVRAKGGAWAFEEMQMSSGSTSVMAHWSAMVQCKPGQPCEGRLPGTKSSLQDFLAICDD
jgi:hypothetical protein